MNKLTVFIFVFLGITQALFSSNKDSLSLFENEAEPIPYSTNEATMFGVGGYQILDTYLSPYTYKGWGLSVANEKLKTVSLFNHHGVRQQNFGIEFSSTENDAKTASYLSGMLSYGIGYGYRFEPCKNLRLIPGVSARALAGFIYNTRNGNNPASMKLDVAANLTGMAIYNFKIREFPLTLRFQTEIPFFSVFFSPNYMQSYYEIFSLGNYKGVVKAGSLHNYFTMRNYLTLDIPIYNYTVRLGYQNNIYKTDVNNLTTHLYSNSFMIGIVKEIVSYSGRKLKNKRGFNSAYY